MGKNRELALTSFSREKIDCKYVEVPEGFHIELNILYVLTHLCDVKKKPKKPPKQTKKAYLPL